MNKFKEKLLNNKQPEEKESVVVEQTEEQKMTDLDYWEIKNPDTGYRYDIPHLDKESGTYVWDYIAMMKLKERQPGTFDRIINWE